MYCKWKCGKYITICSAWRLNPIITAKAYHTCVLRTYQGRDNDNARGLDEEIWFMRPAQNKCILVLRSPLCNMEIIANYISGRINNAYSQLHLKDKVVSSIQLCIIIYSKYLKVLIALKYVHRILCSSDNNLGSQLVSHTDLLIMTNRQ